MPALTPALTSVPVSPSAIASDDGAGDVNDSGEIIDNCCSPSGSIEIAESYGESGGNSMSCSRQSLSYADIPEAVQPATMRGVHMRPYQLQALEWMSQREKGLQTVGNGSLSTIETSASNLKAASTPDAVARNGVSAGDNSQYSHLPASSITAAAISPPLSSSKNCIDQVDLSTCRDRSCSAGESLIEIPWEGLVRSPSLCPARLTALHPLWYD